MIFSRGTESNRFGSAHSTESIFVRAALSVFWLFKTKQKNIKRDDSTVSCLAKCETCQPTKPTADTFLHPEPTTNVLVVCLWFSYFPLCLSLSLSLLQPESVKEKMFKVKTRREIFFISCRLVKTFTFHLLKNFSSFLLPDLIFVFFKVIRHDPLCATLSLSFSYCYACPLCST